MEKAGEILIVGEKCRHCIDLALKIQSLRQEMTELKEQMGKLSASPERKIKEQNKTNGEKDV